MDMVAYVYASSWRCVGCKFDPAAQLSQHLSVVQYVAVHRCTARLFKFVKWSAGGDDATHTFSSADAELQLMLPACIREQYDFQLSARSGVSSDLCDMILATAAKGQSFQGIQGTIEEMHRKRYYRAELAYVNSLPLIDSAFKKAEQDSNVPSTSKAAPGKAHSNL